MRTVRDKLESQSAVKSFFQYLLPTLLGMMLMSVNIVIDGIFVGNGIGPVALASVNIAVPVFFYYYIHHTFNWYWWRDTVFDGNGGGG